MILSAVTVALAGLLAADFGISVDPATIDMSTGQTLQAAVVTTTPVGDGGTVSLAATVSPGDLGVSASLDVPAVPAGGSANLTVVTVGGAAGGTYAVTVTGTEGANVHAATLEVVVIPIKQPGSGGCSTTGSGAGAGGAWLLLGVGAAVLPWRRRTLRAAAARQRAG